MIPRHTSEFHAFDYGTVIEAEVRNGRNQRVNLSDAFAVEILFMRPDGSSFSRPAELGFSDSNSSMMSSMSSSMFSSSGGPLPGEEGIVRYILQPGDLDVPGIWYFQFYIEFGGGAWYSSVITFTVFPNLVSPFDQLSP